MILALITKDQALILTTVGLETPHQLILVGLLLKFLQEGAVQTSCGAINEDWSFVPELDWSWRPSLDSREEDEKF